MSSSSSESGPQESSSPIAASAAVAAPASAPEPGWDSLGLSEAALGLIRKSGYDRPTPVQAEAIPAVIQGRDLVCSAQTGTGKTAAFVLPMVERFVGREGTFGLILAPTREIAQQIHATIELLGVPRGIRSIVLIGGINMRYDDQAIATYPHIIVATPGRLCDHLDRGNIWLDYIEVAVLDEADRMLDMGFADQLNRIMEDLRDTRQTMLFSATIPPMVDRLAQKILKDPVRVAIGKPLAAAGTVEQKLVWMREETKSRELHRLLHRDPGRTIVFTRSKDGATRVWRSLHSAGFYDATYIHSDRQQSHREQALAEFKEGKYRILIATDVAGRGIHVNEVAHVINYDLPMEPEDYIHRIGRTGRAGSSGHSTTFATGRDRKLVATIEKILGYPIPSITLDGGADSDESRPHGRDGGRGGRRGSGGGGSSRGGAHSSAPAAQQGAGAPVRANGHATGRPHPQASDAPVSQSHGPSEGSGPAAATGDQPERKRRRRRGGRGRRKTGESGPASPAGSGA